MSAGQTVTMQAATRRGRDRGFLSGAREIDDTPLNVRGTLPDWLMGTLLLNGPALWELPRGSLAHWFDGYAMLHALRFERSSVRYRSRFARSDSYLRSIASGKPVFGEFGSPNPAGLFKRIRGAGGTDNPAVVLSRHGERWLAVTESPYLTYFDPQTLETGERVHLASSGEAMHLMAAHGFTLADGSYLNVGVELGPKCTLKVFTLAPAEKKPKVLCRIRTAKAGYMHALALAPGHAIVWDCSMRAQALGFRFNAKSYKDNFRWEPGSGAMLHAVPLSGGPARSWRIPPMFSFHAAQAWCDGDDLVLELSIYDDATIFDDLLLAARRSGSPIRSAARLVRYRLRPGATESAPEPVASGIELPQVHPARVGQGRARIVWSSQFGENRELADRVLRLDLDTGSTSQWQRPDAVHLEPLFVPRPGGVEDDDGVLCVPTLADNDRASVVCVVDARTMQCVAEIDAPQVVPFGFHAAFAQA